MASDARVFVCVAALVGCQAPTSSTSPDAATEASPSPPTSVTADEPPIVYAGFDAGGRTEIEIPTVTCDDLGQTGWIKITPPRTWKVKVTKELLALDDPASQLRVYVNPFYVVLGPPGFRCRGWYGSSGGTLSIVPKDGVTPDDEIEREIKGEVVRVFESLWSTSGRLRCARVSARVFPWLRGRARAMYDMYPGFAEMDGFTTAPYHEEIIHVEGMLAHFVDPPWVTAIGFEGAGVTPNEDAIHGSTVQRQSDSHPVEASLLTLAVRLRAEREPLIAAILADFDQRMSTCSPKDDCFDVGNLPRCYDGTDDVTKHCPSP